jgi:hypothetical protein
MHDPRNNLAIAANAWKIHSLGNYQDFVGPLLRSPAGDSRHLGGASTSGVAHVIDALFDFDSDGSLCMNPFRPQSQGMAFVHDLTVYLSDNWLAEGDKYAAATALGQIANLFLSGKADGVNLPALLDALGSTFGYSSQYLKELREGDPEKYARYRDGLIQYFHDIGNAYLGCALWSSLEMGRPFFPSSDYTDQVVAIAVGAERDFTQATKGELVNVIKAVEAHASTKWSTSNWGAWDKPGASEVAEWRYQAFVDEYYEEVSRLNSHSVAQIEAIFEKVDQTDESYGGKMSEQVGNLETLVQGVRELAGSIG